MSSSTQQFLAELEKHAGRPLHHPEQIAALINAANARDLAQPLLDAMFHAKFTVKSQEVMRRIGPGGDGFDKLSSEFQSSIEKTKALLQTIVKESPEDEKKTFVGQFFTLEQENFRRLLELCEDLARLKNWEVDGKPLPFGAPLTTPLPDTSLPHTPLPHTSPPFSVTNNHMTNLIRTSRLATVLLILFFIFEPPFTILGWIVALVVLSLMIIVQFEAVQVRKGMA